MIEIPKGSRNKYEYDPNLGQIKLDRFISASVVTQPTTASCRRRWPRTATPLDVLVCVSEPTFPGWVVLAKPIGLLRMSDEKGTHGRAPDRESSS
jgi:inorganic pyrophosphatase